MLLTKKRINKPKFIEIVRNEIEVVTEFKLLGVIIDDKLQFNKHIDNLKQLVNRKLYSIKKVFHLSESVKVHLFKAFILPHFKYCRLTIYAFY